MRPKEQTSRRLKLQHLNVFFAVAKTGSMARAAKQLAISQPVISRTIAALENTLDVRLFDRSPVGVELTPYGRVLLKRNGAIFDDLNESVGDIQALADPSAGELHIGSNDAQAGFIATVVERLLQKYPRMTFKISSSNTAALIDRDL